MGLVAGLALQLTRQMRSLEAAQRLCDQMLAIPSPGGSFFQAAISMELAAMPSTPQSISRVRRLFEVTLLAAAHPSIPCSLIAGSCARFCLCLANSSLFTMQSMHELVLAYFCLTLSYGCHGDRHACEHRWRPSATMCCCMQAGVAAHGSVDHELWLQYAAFEQKQSKGAGNVYWRAVKALAEPDEFVAMYSGGAT